MTPLSSCCERAQAALGEARARATAEGEKYNLIEFKYQLLVDMWTMRVLDNGADPGSLGECSA